MNNKELTKTLFDINDRYNIELFTKVEILIKIVNHLSCYIKSRNDIYGDYYEKLDNLLDSLE